MSDHYYSEIQHTESDPKYWDANIHNRMFRFKTDLGVFSKKYVDFGSRLLIETLLMEERKGPFLDVGCGYGPIGLAIASMYPETIVHMVDVNERALSLAEENATLNELSNVKIYKSDRLLGVNKQDFSVIVTNPPIRAGKRIVHDIFSQALEHLQSQGELWVVIQKKQGAPSAQTKLQELYENVDVVTKKKGYYILKAIKR